MTEAADDVPNVLIIRVMVVLTCKYTGNFENGVSSMIVMVLFIEYIDYNQRISLLLIKEV